MAYTQAQLQERTRQAAIRYGLNPNIALAQIRQESGFNPNARSTQGAQGIAQFMPGTWASWGEGSPFDPTAALDAYARHMRYLLDRFNGDYRLALAAYHSGEGAARAALNNCKGNPRTCNYVNSIMGSGGAGSILGGGLPSLPSLPGLSLGGIQINSLWIAGFVAVVLLLRK